MPTAIVHDPKTETPQIRIVFMGTPVFAETILRHLLDKKYHIVAVYTQPDKPSGRSQKLVASPVKQLAEANAIPVEQPEKFNDAALSQFTSYKPDLVVVVAYGKILPKSVLEVPGFGCVNIHPSLLPKFRGPSPIQNALLLGEKETGVSIMLMDEGMDTGDILIQKSLAIQPLETAEELSARLSQLAAPLLDTALLGWIERTAQPKPQDSSQATLCQLIEREDGHIVWTDDAESIFNRFRALYPWPGIYSFWKKDEGLLRLKLTRISFQKQNPQVPHHHGEIFELGEKIGVQASQGIIFLEEVQLEGKTALSIQEFVKGYPQCIGSILQ